MFSAGPGLQNLAWGDKACADGDRQQRQGLSGHWAALNACRAIYSSLGWKRAEPQEARAESRKDYPCSIPAAAFGTSRQGPTV